MSTKAEQVAAELSSMPSQAAINDAVARLDPIFDEIVNERAYQQTKWGDGFDSKNTCNDWVTYICRYATKACVLNWDPNVFRTMLVKTATLCCAAIEWCDRTGGNMPKRHYD